MPKKRQPVVPGFNAFSVQWMRHWPVNRYIAITAVVGAKGLTFKPIKYALLFSRARVVEIGRDAKNKIHVSRIDFGRYETPIYQKIAPYSIVGEMRDHLQKVLKDHLAGTGQREAIDANTPELPGGHYM
jgi:hypothetical protein